MALKVVALAGGVGGAKLVHGLQTALPAEDLTVIVNTGDDFDHLGLRVCPDLDTVVYTLAGIANRRTGWGRAGETWSFLETTATLGGPTWFRLGDRDVALHVHRTQRLRDGLPLSRITHDVCRALGIPCAVLPMTDDEVRTVVITDRGEMAFQEYFVRRACEPMVRGFRFSGAEAARPAPGVLEAVRIADLIVLCPSNPWVSIDPILAVPGIRSTAEGKTVVAISPLVGGQAVKGPAAKMAAELAVDPTPQGIGAHYGGLLNGLVYDQADPDVGPALLEAGLRSLRTRTLMRSDRDRRRLAEEILAFGAAIAQKEVS